MKSRKRMILYTLLCLAAAIALSGILFVSQPSFGRLPRAERLERVRRSPNYRDGAFRNLQTTPQLTSKRSRMATLLGFLFRDQQALRPAGAVPAVKTDLRSLPADRNLLVWFGHSSYLLQADGLRVLVDPVFYAAAPLNLLNRPFDGTDLYTPDDMPDIDCLVITHDHWDHLDYRTVRQLKDRIRKVVCPLGVGEHFERWGFSAEQLIELDWQEASTAETLHICCLPARHFSGRGLRPNQTLWASFLLEFPTTTIYIGGDSGYGRHFAEIGAAHPGIDLAILENGQYNADWRYIHTMPDQLPHVAADLGAKRVMTVHHSKYALALHPWDEPLETERRMARGGSPEVLIPEIGEVMALDGTE